MALNKNVSIFLDALRLFAALLVFVGHAGSVFQIELPSLVGHSAKEGVAIFFVLSGFVIAFVTQEKEPNWRAFAKARALRMYSVVPLAAAVLIGCYFLGSTVNPALYAAGAGGGVAGDPPSGWLLLRYVTFTNELWFDRGMIQTGAPFWSLAFEVAYYIGFAIWFYGHGRWRWAGIVLWFLVFGPRVALAFPLWLIGAVAWKALGRRWRLSPMSGGVALVALGLGGLVWRRSYATVAMPLFEWSSMQKLAFSMGYYVVLCGLIAAAIVVFAASVPDRDLWPNWSKRVIRFWAGASFTLYIAHLPVMVLLTALWPECVGSAPRASAASAITIVAMLFLAELGERRKGAYQRISLALRPGLRMSRQL